MKLRIFLFSAFTIISCWFIAGCRRACTLILRNDVILLVSSSDHTYRTSMVFRSACSKLKNPSEIICSSGKYTGFNAENWWKQKESIQNVLLEYLKLLSYVAIERKDLKNEILVRETCPL